MTMLFSLWCLVIDDCALFYFLCLQVTTLVGHDDAVQSVVFDKSGEFMVSGGTDCTVRIWS